MDRLHKQIAELTDLLALERSGKRQLEDTVGGLRTTLQASAQEQTRLRGVLIDAGSGAAGAR